MEDGTCVWDSKSDGNDVRKRVYFSAHGDFGFDVLFLSGNRVGGMALQHTEGIPMFYLLCAYLNSRKSDVPELDFGGLEDCVDSDQKEHAKELLRDHERYSSHEYVLFEKYPSDIVPMFSLNGSNYVTSHPAYLTDDDSLGFICEERGKGSQSFGSGFCMTFSKEDSVEAIKGMVDIYRAGDIRVVLLGFKTIADYFREG